jgi:phosphate transport system protein
MSRIPTLDTQIHRMKTLLRAMCDRVLVGLNVVVTHMDHPQEDELIKTIVLDSEVDNLEKEVDEAILQIFATQQPLAADLRLAYACAKITHHIERIGDAVESLSRQLAGKPLPYQSQTIALMMNETRSLFMRSYLAMFEGDNLQIHDIHQADDAVDNFYRELFSFARNLLIQKNNPQDVEEALRIINISSKLEKIADLSCNWAEQIDFAHNGLARKKLQKRKHKILFFDHDGGRSACLVACMLQQQLGDLFDIGVATCSPINSQDYTDVHALLEKLKISPEVFPLANFRTVTWARALMCIQIGKFALSSWDRELVPYKTVFLNWTQQWLELKETDPAIGKLQEKVTELSKILIRTKGR